MAGKVPLAIVAAGLLSSSAVAHACSFRGTGVGEDTGEPLAGAAVLAVLYRGEWIGFPEPSTHFQAVRETTTNGAGRYSMSAWRGIDWHPNSYVLKPGLVVLKPGYEALRIEPYSGDDQRRHLFLGGTIRLKKLPPARCATTDAGRLIFFMDVPYERIPNLLRLVDLERRRCGLH